MISLHELIYIYKHGMPQNYCTDGMIHYESNTIHEVPVFLLIEFAEYKLQMVIKTSQLHNRLLTQHGRFTNTHDFFSYCFICLLWDSVVTTQHREGIDHHAIEIYKDQCKLVKVLCAAAKNVSVLNLERRCLTTIILCTN